MAKIRSSIFLLCCLVFIIIGCASRAPLPSTLNIVPPAPEVPSKLAAFSGIWEGQGYDLLLVVEKIDSQNAEVILSSGMTLGYDPAYEYRTAEVLSDSSIKVISPNGDIIIFEMDDGLNSLSVTLTEKDGAKYRLFMSRRKTA